MINEYLTFYPWNLDRLLEKLNHNPEYFDKDNNQNGVLDNQNDTDEGYPYSGDISTEEGVVKNPNPGEFTTLIIKKDCLVIK